MIFVFKNLKLKKDFDRIKLLFYAHLSLVFCAFIVENTIFSVQIGALFLKAIVAFIFYQLLYKTIENIFYTFWTLTFLLLIYLVFGALNSLLVLKSQPLAYIYLLALLFLSIQAFILNSPIYYPIVRWWEYDFRYRHDLKVKVFHKDYYNEMEGRLLDLRRGAAGVVLFEELEDKENFVVKISNDGQNLLLKAEIMSRRENSFGRGHIYGVKFHFNTKEEKKDFSRLSKIWKSGRKSKIRMKFKNSKA